jgi:hypothetical protein
MFSKINPKRPPPDRTVKISFNNAVLKKDPKTGENNYPDFDNNQIPSVLKRIESEVAQGAYRIDRSREDPAR